MAQEVVVTCAVTGAHSNFAKHPNFPITPKQIADACIEARKAGAAVTHIHVRDPKTGEARGVSIDLTNELALRLGVKATIVSSPTPTSVIETVAKGEADIGFVAFDPSRAGTVEFSQTYMLVGQTFMVPENSPIRSVADIDKPGQKIGAGKGKPQQSQRIDHATLE